MGSSEVINQLVNLTEAKRELDKDIRRALKQHLKTAAAGTADAELHTALQDLLNEVDPRHLELWMLYSWVRKAGLNTSSFTSWQTLLAARAMVKGMREPAWKLDDKRTAYKFADSIGVRRPWVSTSPIPLSDVDTRRSPFVLKPSTGQSATGVYLVFSPERIFSVKDAQNLAGTGELRDHAQALLSSERVAKDAWIQEELVLDAAHTDETPARDLKFFTFYGQIKRIDEIARFPSESKDFYDGAGTRLETSPFKNWSGKRLDGAGVTEDELQLIKRISLSIPAPFIRIDMLKGRQGLVLGEFTPAPGSAGQLKKSWDEALGEAYLQAEGRLRTDLMSGKDFGPFWNSSQG